MNTIISNDIIINNPSSFVREFAKNEMIVNNPEYQQMKILGKEDLIKWKHIPEKLNLFIEKGNKMIFPFGTLRSLYDEIIKYPYELRFNDNKDISIKNDSPTFPLYDYQEEAVNIMVKAKGGVLVAPCGAGKTISGIEIIRKIGKRALWLCHTGDLLRQAMDDMLEQYPNIKIGLTTKGKLEIGEDVTISTIQTMEKIDPDLYKNEFDIVVCDESAHVAASPTQMKMFTKVISKIPARYKYGLTATPQRSDGMIKAMYCYIGTDKDGNFKPMFKVDRNKVKTIQAIHKKFEFRNGYDNYEKMYDLYDSAGMMNYNNLISELSENKGRNEKIVDNILKCHNEGRKQVVLCLRVNHCEELKRMLEEKGIKVQLCVGKVSDKKRKQILKQEVEWDVIVATYSLLKEGVSIKELDTLHMTVPIADKGMTVQCAGRIERYIENKKQPIIYDYVDMDIPYCEKKFNLRKRYLKSRF